MDIQWLNQQYQFNMKQKLTIKVPKDYSAINLKQYLQFRDELENYKDDPDAIETILLHYICGVPAEFVSKIDSETYIKIKRDLSSFMNNTDYPLQKFITIDGVEYGFEPNLSRMSYGAYLDIAKYDTITIDKNWAKMMDILYRPVTNKTGALYEIKPYDGSINEDKWYDVGMDIHFGTLFFFSDLLKDLVNSTQKSLMGVEGISQNIKSVLERNGNLTPQ